MAKATKQNKSHSSSSTNAVRVRLPSGNAYVVTTGLVLQQAAMRWSRILRNRRRWVDDPDLRAAQQRSLLDVLAKLGIDSVALRNIANARIVEVDIPYSTGDTLWEARIFPWEPVLAEATNPLRGTEPLTVVRCLQTSRHSSKDIAAFKRALYLEAAPGSLQDVYTFASERRLVRAGLGLKADDYLQVINPTRDQLAAALDSFRPDLIHVAGVDPHQAVTLLGKGQQHRFENGSIPGESQVRDGMLLSAGRGKLDLVSAAQAAALLCAHNPRLICFNMFNTAARLAALTVAEGAEAAIGFQDEVADDVAEMLYTNFYGALRQTKGDVATSFAFAWGEILDQPHRLRGSGVVLWGAQPWLNAIPVQSTGHKSKSLQHAKTMLLNAGDAKLNLDVEVIPLSQLNYSMLHNRRSLFERFVLRKPPGRMEDVSVTVQLDAGIPFRACITTDRCPEDLGERISVPLTSALARSARENVNTTLYVQVKWGGKVLYDDTHRVTLLPVDEWRDDDSNRVWLPSFVLPRDPAVPSIIQLAEGALRTLEDSRVAGFDGYQRVESDVEESLESVDLQVRAIWCALAYQSSIAYVNPPPTFTISSQRLRMPHEVMEGRRGTCIDLALLIAACLEHVEIYPVIFLLNGHAFVGYWRSPDAFENFRSGGADADRVSKKATKEAKEGVDGAGGQRYPWYFDRIHYPELLREIHRGALVPIEATKLTDGSPFAEAVEEGGNNLRSRAEFHSMIDIVLARAQQVTPLPMREEGL